MIMPQEFEKDPSCSFSKVSHPWLGSFTGYLEQDNQRKHQ